ncbi:MAG: MFS transporter [Candidatus Thorarchaeota archaeon]
MDGSRLTPDETQKALSNMIKQGVSVQVKLTLTESIFLVGFALMLGASNTVIGILAAIPSFAQLLQIPSVYLIKKIGSRRKLNFTTQLGNRLAILLMALIPFISVSELGLLLLVSTVAIQAVFVAIGSASWNSWLRDLVPEEQLGQFFSKRMALGGVMAVISSLAGGAFIGRLSSLGFGMSMMSYSTLFLVAFLAGMIALYYTSTTPEPKTTVTEAGTSFFRLVARPFQDLNFRSLLWFSAAWTFSTALATPFFAVYLLSRLGLGMPLATALTATTQLVSILFYRFWGRYSDRFSNKSVLQVATPIFLIGTFLWTFTNIAGALLLLIPLLFIIHLLTGFSAAGVDLTSDTIGLKLAPRGESAAYLAARGTVMAVAGTIGPIVGGLLADLFAARELYFSITLTDPGGTLVIHTYHVMGLDFLFLISVVLGLYSLHRLSLVQEVGEVEEKVVIEAIAAETRRNVKTISTVDGLRQTFQIPIKTTRRLVKRRRRVATREKPPSG